MKTPAELHSSRSLAFSVRYVRSLKTHRGANITNGSGVRPNVPQVLFVRHMNQAPYCSSLTFSIHSTALPSSASAIATCVIEVVGVAPCQCLSFDGHQIISPGRISTFGWPSLCTQPQPDVTMRVCPSGCRCHAVRAPGSKVTIAPPADKRHIQRVLLWSVTKISDDAGRHRQPL